LGEAGAEPVGVSAGDEECFSMLSALFDPVIAAAGGKVGFSSSLAVQRFLPGFNM